MNSQSMPINDPPSNLGMGNTPATTPSVDSKPNNTNPKDKVSVTEISPPLAIPEDKKQEPSTPFARVETTSVLTPAPLQQQQPKVVTADTKPQIDSFANLTSNPTTITESKVKDTNVSTPMHTTSDVATHKDTSVAKVVPPSTQNTPKDVPESSSPHEALVTTNKSSSGSKFSLFMSLLVGLVVLVWIGVAFLYFSNNKVSTPSATIPTTTSQLSAP